ncbi:tetratricopeptide repeat protein [Streptomyces misionensis]|uniref:tetratricopeptide repeat protein n=1 Tax=Streptomyces misionensis TaxID=67331 RepID=UPI003810CE09
MAIATEIRSAATEAHWLLALGDAQRATGQPARAQDSYRRAAALQEELGDRARRAAAWDGLGQACLQLGRAEEAADCHRRAAETFRDLRLPWETARTLAHLALALDHLPAPQEAADVRARVLGLLTEFADRRALRLRDSLVRRSPPGDTPP